MSSGARLALAAAVLKLGWLLSQRVDALRSIADVRAEHLAFAMGALEVRVATVAVAGALLLPGGVADRLGLRAGRLPASAVAALALGALGLSHAVDAALALTRTTEGSVVEGISVGLRDATRVGGRGFVVAVLGTVLAPALAEELLCRGLIQRSLLRPFVRVLGALGPPLAIASAAAFFGALHGEWVHGGIAALLGAYFGLAAWWADSTRPAIAAHALNNFMALLGSLGLLALPLAPQATIPLGLGLAVAGLCWAGLCRPRGVGPPGPAPPARLPTA